MGAIIFTLFTDEIAEVGNMFGCKMLIKQCPVLHFKEFIRAGIKTFLENFVNNGCIESFFMSRKPHNGALQFTSKWKKTNTDGDER
jgi:hypothetical protein